MTRTIVAVAAVQILVGGLGLAGDTSTLSGTFTNSAVDDGTKAYLKLVSDGDCMAPGPGEHATMATFAEGKASYSIEGVAGGSYTACAFIDVVTQEGEINADSGDYGATQDVAIEGDTTLDLDEGSWVQIP
jgi:hypothetical protein